MEKLRNLEKILSLLKIWENKSTDFIRQHFSNEKVYFDEKKPLGATDKEKEFDFSFKVRPNIYIIISTSKSVCPSVCV